jgi:hypothetical protein
MNAYELGQIRAAIAERSRRSRQFGVVPEDPAAVRAYDTSRVRVRDNGNFRDQSDDAILGLSMLETMET